MDTPDLSDRVTLLERLAAQQLDVNDQLLALTRRLGEEQALYQQQLTFHAEVLMRHEERLNQHDALMQRLAQTLEAIRDMLERGQNGH